MKTVLHYVRINYALMLFALCALTLIVSVSYAMLSAFGAYALIFLALGGYVSYALSTGLINFTLN